MAWHCTALTRTNGKQDFVLELREGQMGWFEILLISEGRGDAAPKSVP